MKDQLWQASYTNGTTPLTLSEEVGRAFAQRNSANGADIFIDSVAHSGRQLALNGPPWPGRSRSANTRFGVRRSLRGTPRSDGRVTMVR
jgi:hypothetical protein